MFQSLVDGMVSLLNWFYHLTVMINLPNYGLAIIFFTVLVKLVLYPLTHKQMQSMIAMQQLAPKVKEIQEKYKAKDPQKMQQKIMELYKEHKINPLSGCLPLLIQMPILIALYRALYNFKYAESVHAQFLWVTSLSAIGIHQVTDLILPVLSGLTTYLQTKMVSNVNDPTQKTMLLVMPFFIIWISTTVPAGLVLYWVAFNVLSIGQQYLVNRQTQGLKEALEKSGGNRKVGKNSKRGVK